MSSADVLVAATDFPELTEVQQLVINAAAQHTCLQRNDSRLSRPAKLKRDGSKVTDIDLALQSELKHQLQQRWPQWGFIGEEMSHDEQLAVCCQSPFGYWVVDPLDGTTNFASGFLFYGVSLALVVDGHSRLAVIFDPVRNECFTAAQQQGAYLNGVRLQTAAGGSIADCIANVDYKRLVASLSERLVHSPPYRSQRNLGSSVLEWCWLAADRIQLYLHGGQKLWDFAAGYLILLEAGGAATSLSGLPLDCAKLAKRSVVAASNAALLEQWVGWLKHNAGDTPAAV